MSKKKIIGYIVTAACVIAVFYVSVISMIEKPQQSSYTSATLEIRGKTVRVELADTPEKSRQGLSGHNPLGKGEGMLFIFTSPARYSFWMKDMRFPLDMIWIGEDWRGVDITKRALPESYPGHFQPSFPVQYVLEVSAGFSDANNITIGDAVIYNK